VRVLGRLGDVGEELRATDCAHGFTRAFDAGSTNNASSLASDAPGTNPQNSVTPTFVSAMTDLHLASGDTAWKDRGTDLSADALYPFSSGGDGAARTGTWDIGAHRPAVWSAPAISSTAARAVRPTPMSVADA